MKGLPREYSGLRTGRLFSEVGTLTDIAYAMDVGPAIAREMGLPPGTVTSMLSKIAGNNHRVKPRKYNN